MKEENSNPLWIQTITRLKTTIETMFRKNYTRITENASKVKFNALLHYYTQTV